MDIIEVKANVGETLEHSDLGSTDTPKFSVVSNYPYPILQGYLYMCVCGLLENIFVFLNTSKTCLKYGILGNLVNISKNGN